VTLLHPPTVWLLLKYTSYPAPCSRCKGKDLECKLDPSFKQVPAKECAFPAPFLTVSPIDSRQLKKINDELENLRAATHRGALPSRSSESFSEQKHDLFSLPLVSGSRDEEHSQWLNLSEPYDNGPWSLESVIVTQDLVLELV
jgi:hypothetical protein